MYLVVFLAIPIFIVIGYSFHARDFYGGVLPTYSGKAWQHSMGSASLNMVTRSVFLALGVTVCCLIIGYMCAMGMVMHGVRRRRLLLILIAFPMISSLQLRIYGWMNLLPVQMKGNYLGVIVVMTTTNLPFMLLPLLRSFERMDKNLILAAQDLGANGWQTFWRIQWPVTQSGRWVGCALVFIPALADYLIPFYVGEGKVRVLGILIVEQFMQRRNWPYGAALTSWLLLFLIVVGLILIIQGTRAKKHV